MEDFDDLRHILREQDTHELLCPDCDSSITHHVILRKSKRDSATSAPEGPAGPAAEDLDELADVLLHQGNHDLICPVCDVEITHQVILQKRKREPGAAFKRRDELLEADDPWGTWGKRCRPEDSEEEVVFHMLNEQTTHELICPDCDASITHELILRQRRRPVFQSVGGGRTVPRLEEIFVQLGRDVLEPARIVGEIHENGKNFEEDPPLKRSRKADEERRRILRGRISHDASDPDYNLSKEVFQKSVKGKTEASPLEESVVHKQNRGWRGLTGHNHGHGFDKNPWKRRYKLFYGKGGTKHAATEAASEDPGLRLASYGLVANRSLTEPLLPQRTDPRLRTVNISGQSEVPNMYEDKSPDPWYWRYFCALFFLWVLWCFLRII